MRRPACRLAVVPCLLALLLAACAGDGLGDGPVRETVETVLTLQGGTVSELRGRRGTGPFRTWPLAPEAMVGVLEEAARKARGADGLPVRAIFAAPHRGEVVAKERAPGAGDDTSYEGPFRTAMIAIAHPVPGRPDASLVEIHAIQRGPFHRGVVAWERDMPRWIGEVLAERREADEPVRPIPPGR